jgi:hypothetical protein
MAVTTLNADTTASLGTAIANSGVANTKTGYTEFTGSAAVSVQGIIIASVMGTASGDALYDIATGAASSETDVLANITSARTSTFNVQQFYFPIQIASGARISGRYQSTSTTQAWRPVIYLLSGITVPFENCTSAVTYGAVTADSGGTSIDPGGSSHTKGSYVEISASTSADIDWLLVCFGNQVNGARADASWFIDVATGGAGAESVVAADLHMTSHSADDRVEPASYLLPLTISSGTRIAVRAQCSITDATDRLFDVVLVGFNGTAPAAGGGGQHFSASFMG